MDTANERMIQTANEILDFSACGLTSELPALNYAFKALTFEAAENADRVSTDGTVLIFSAEDIIVKFTKDKSLVARCLLHSVFHCVFRHMYRVYLKNRSVWDIACDISVENAIFECGIECVKSNRDESIINMTAENLYYYFLDNEISPRFYREVFALDSHDLWYGHKNGAVKDDKYSEKGETPSIYKMSDNRPSDGTDETERTSGDNGNRNENEKEKWERIGKRIDIRLDTLSSQRGNLGGNIITELKEINRERYNYSDFLRLFAANRESKEINLDEFDSVYYTYGLKLYKNMPLIEPLEYREAKKINDFIIAVDTSGSVRGETVKSFIEATFSILKRNTVLSPETKIHIIQCDAAVRDDRVIASESDLENYIENLKLQGFGGTDFRPVFNYTDELIKMKATNNVSGLIYFTDGDGIYPEKQPKYKTAFILTDGKNIGKVPNWSLKTILGREQLKII